MPETALTKLKKFGDLKASGYTSKDIKTELRDNLIQKLQEKEEVFADILGYEHSVIPDLQRAILSRHNINLLGLRGQAKTSIARAMIRLLDEYIPVIEGSEINDDPFDPISQYGRELVDEKGDDAPVSWLHRSERYTEKLATPDVTVADLIGDIDPIKAANQKLHYSDERVIHFGLVPNSNRGLFVINELPDLQPRIQVALFNILQEGDIQIRGFKIRLPLDIQFLFTANPEDYTNRGSIITPLKDRIQSQIITHYPRSIEVSKKITQQEANLEKAQEKRVKVPELVEDLLENIAFEARASEYIDQNSGVSARLTITAYENLVSAAERRAMINKEKKTVARVGDLIGTVPSITGKVELVYEGEQEGAGNVAHNLIGKSIRKMYPTFFPDPDLARKRKENEENPYSDIIGWFNSNELELYNDSADEDFRKELDRVKGLRKLVEKYQPEASKEEEYLWMEFVLHGLAEYSLISKNFMETGLSFKDILNSVFSGSDFGEEGF